MTRPSLDPGFSIADADELYGIRSWSTGYFGISKAGALTVSHRGESGVPIVAMVDDLAREDCVSDATWAQLAERYSDEQLVELVMLAGYYRMISGFLNSAGVQLDEGVYVEMETLGLSRRFPRMLGWIIEPIARRTVACCRRALQDAGVRTRDLDGVVLVGGSTRVPLVRTLVASTFRQEPLGDIDPDKVVAYGAAIQADILSGSEREGVTLLDVVPLVALRAGVGARAVRHSGLRRTDTPFSARPRCRGIPTPSSSTPRGSIWNSGFLSRTWSWHRPAGTLRAIRLGCNTAFEQHRGHARAAPLP